MYFILCRKFCILLTSQVKQIICPKQVRTSWTTKRNCKVLISFTQKMSASNYTLDSNARSCNDCKYASFYFFSFILQLEILSLWGIRTSISVNVFCNHHVRVGRDNKFNHTGIILNTTHMPEYLELQPH